MFTNLLLLLILMILGAIIALEAKNLISAIISLGIVGFGLTLVFLVLQAPDLAIVQVLKTTAEDTLETMSAKKLFLYLGGFTFLFIFMWFINAAFKFLPPFGQPLMRMADAYVKEGLNLTGAANLVSGVILDFRAYDTLGEATVLFTAVIGVITVLRKVGRKK